MGSKEFQTTPNYGTWYRPISAHFPVSLATRQITSCQPSTRRCGANFLSIFACTKEECRLFVLSLVRQVLRQKFFPLSSRPSQEREMGILPFGRKNWRPTEYTRLCSNHFLMVMARVINAMYLL